MRIVFAGTPEFAVPVLAALDQGDQHIVAVYTQPDRPSGRGRKLGISPVKDYALEHDIEVFQPSKLGPGQALDEFTGHHADVMVVAAYGLIVPECILNSTPLGGINVHASILPRWRGAAPIARAIEAGDTSTGVSIMQMDRGLDTGPVFATGQIEIDRLDTAATLHDKLADLGAQLLAKSLPRIASGELEAIEQDHDRATYAHKLTKTEGLISWSAAAAHVVNKIRAFNPWPVAYSFHSSQRIRIWRAEVYACDLNNAAPGTILRAGPDGILIASGAAAVLISVLQRQGGRALSASEFLNGYPLTPGEKFE